MCSRRCGSIGQAAKRPVDCRGIVSGSLLALTSIAAFEELLKSGSLHRDMQDMHSNPIGFSSGYS